MRTFISLFQADPSSLDDLYPFETSWLLPPVLLAALRALIAIYVFFTIFFVFGWEGTHSQGAEIGQSFSYFTWLTFWGVGFYFLVSSIHTFLYATTGRSVLLDSLPRFLRGLHSLLYTSITTFPFLVMIVYWAILYEAPWFPVVFDAWQNISQHALPSLFVLLEILLATTPPHPLLHLPVLIVILLLYLSLAYITHYTEGFYTYSFLDPGSHHQHSGLVAGYCFGILAAILVIFGLSWLLIWARRRVVGGKIKRAVRDVRRGGGYEYEVRQGLGERGLEDMERGRGGWAEK